MSASALADTEGRKVFLGGLSFDTREDDLRADFTKYGELEDLQLPMDSSGVKHKGFAFLTYLKPEDAEYVCKEHHQKEYMGRDISAKIVVPRAERNTGGDRGMGGDRHDDRRGRGGPGVSRETNDKLDAWVEAKRRRDFETADRLRKELQDDGINAEELRPKPGYGGPPPSSYGRGGDRYDDRRGGDRNGYDDRRGGYDDRRDDRHGGDRYDDRRRSYSPDRRRRSNSPDGRRDYDRRDRDDRHR